VVFKMRDGEMSEDAPEIYQEIAGVRVPVEGASDFRQVVSFSGTV